MHVRLARSKGGKNQGCIISIKRTRIYAISNQPLGGHGIISLSVIFMFLFDVSTQERKKGRREGGGDGGGCAKKQPDSVATFFSNTHQNRESEQ